MVDFDLGHPKFEEIIVRPKIYQITSMRSSIYYVWPHINRNDYKRTLHKERHPVKGEICAK